jgi:hypothetical protein
MTQLYEYLMANMQRTQAAAAQESPYISQIGGDANKFLGEIDKKNYGAGFTPGTFWHMDSYADRSAHRDKLMNAGPQGDAALVGGQNSAFLDLDKENRKAEFDTQYGREFQDTVRSQTQNAKNAQYQIGQLDQNRKMGAASDITGLLGTAFQAQNTKPAPAWQGLVMGGLQALPGIIQSFKGPNDDEGGQGGYNPGSMGQGPYGTGQMPYPAQPFSTTRTYSNRGWR